MNTMAIPEPEARAIREAAAAAYDDVRWTAGDSRELAAVMLRLAQETWRGGYAAGLRHGRDE